MLKGVIAMVLAGVAGAALWGGIAYATGYEAAAIAWLIGLLVGGVTAFAAGGSANAVTGLLAMVVTAISIAGGKYAVMEFYLQEELAKMEANGGFLVQLEKDAWSYANDDERMIMVLASEVVAECHAEGIELVWPGGSEPEDFESRADYPAGVWDEAAARWEYMPEEERQYKRQDLVDVMMIFAAAQADEIESGSIQEARSLGFISTFGVMDLLFFGLAVSSAFKLGSGMGGEVT